jgi:hypothetical protein
MRYKTPELLRVFVFMQNVTKRTLQPGERINPDDTTTVLYTDAQDKVILMRRGLFIKADETVLAGNFGRFEVEMD